MKGTALIKQLQEFGETIKTLLEEDDGDTKVKTEENAVNDSIDALSPQELAYVGFALTLLFAKIADGSMVIETNSDGLVLDTTVVTFKRLMHLWSELLADTDLNLYQVAAMAVLNPTTVVSKDELSNISLNDERLRNVDCVGSC